MPKKTIDPVKYVGCDFVVVCYAYQNGLPKPTPTEAWDFWAADNKLTPHKVDEAQRIGLAWLVPVPRKGA